MLASNRTFRYTGGMNKSPFRSSRRRFLQSGSAASVGTILGASSLQLLTTRKSAAESGASVVGSGEHTYECEHGWGTLPEGHHYGGASHGVAIDSAGRIYISHLGAPDSVFVFDPDGTFVKSMFPEHSLGPDSAKGHGIDIRSEEDGMEYLYLSPASGSMAFTKATLDGEIVWTRGREEIEGDIDRKLERFTPTNASFAPGGDVLFGDGYGSGHIFRYTRDGDFVAIFGGTGSEDGKFKTPHGQWLDERDGTPKTVVCDRANKRLQWFDMDDRHLNTMEGFLFPADIDIRGEVMLVPDLHARVTLLDGGNEVITHLGDDEPWRRRVLDKREKMRASPDKWEEGKFIHPHDAAFDSDGNIFLTEWVVGGRVTKLVRKG